MPMLDTLYIFDMDRCTMNTEAIMMHLSAVLESFGLDHVEAEAERKMTVDSPTLNIWDHLQTVILPRHNIDIADIKQALLAAAPDYSLLYPGAKELLEKTQGQAFVMTFGASEWQLLKAKICGVNQLAPILVVDTHEKGGLIASAKQPDGTYMFTLGDISFTAKSIVLVDDKAEAFKDLPADCRGYQINNGQWFWFQEGELPANAERLDDFRTFMERENLWK